MADTRSKAPDVVIVPTPGIGHLTPLVEFAKRLLLQHHFSVTFILPTDGPISTAHKTILENLPAGISYTALPPVSFDDLPEDVKIETRISLQITRSLPAFRDAFKSIVAATETVALVVDLFGTDAFDVAVEFDVPPYIFFPTTAMCLSLFLNLPEIDRRVLGEYREMTEPLQIPGCIPIRGKDLLEPVQDRKNEAYKWVLHHTNRYRMAAGIVVNSFEHLEAGALKALQEPEPGKPPVYPVGPLTKIADTGSGRNRIVEWLDEQPRGSVIYVSFGSGGTHTRKQLHEIAWGLESSEQRFIWVVKCPNDAISNAAYFSVQSSTNPFDFLPEGMGERTKDRGQIIPDWAPQSQILSHESVGGFLTHCGWNSILESLVHGVPLIAWPMYAEQRMNAVMLTEDLKVALKPKAAGEDDGLVGRVEIGNAIKALIQGEEGKEVRKRTKEVKEAGQRVLSPDGSSTEALARLASKLKSN